MEYLIAMGANLPSEQGDLRDTFAVALELLAAEGTNLVAISRIYRTPAVPAGAGPDFLNATISVRAAMSPAEMLATLHRIEAALGRTRVRRWEARVIDLDLLAAGQTILPDEATLRRWMDLDANEQASLMPDQMILPHPRLHQRAFVLLPLCDIAPDWRHPVTQRNVMEMRDDLPPEALAGISVLDDAG